MQEHTLFPLDPMTQSPDWGSTRPLVGQVPSPLCGWSVCFKGERSTWERNVHAPVKMSVAASYPPFIFTNVHFFLSVFFFFFILPRDDDWQINICLTTCLRNQKEGAVRITCQKMRLGAVVICWGLQSFRDKVSFNEAKKPPLKKKEEEEGVREG